MAEGRLGVRRHHGTFRAWILEGEGLQVSRVKIAGAPFALDAQRRAAVANPDKVHFMPPLVAPVAQVARLGVGLNFVQDEMFPQAA